MAAIPSLIGANLAVRSAVAAGSSATDATQLVSSSMTVTFVTGANGTKGVKLPAAVTGKVVIVKNDDTASATLKVYPGTGAAINTASSFDLTAGKTGIFIAISATAWIVLSAA